MEFLRLEDENNKNSKIIENFLNEAGKNVGEFLLGKDINFLDDQGNSKNLI